jgi:hypothetical protein
MRSQSWYLRQTSRDGKNKLGHSQRLRKDGPVLFRSDTFGFAVYNTVFKSAKHCENSDAGPVDGDPRTCPLSEKARGAG